MARKLIAVLAFLLLFGATACGGDDGGSSDESAEDSSQDEGSDDEASDDEADDEDAEAAEEDYVDEVTEICFDWWTDILEAGRDDDESSDLITVQLGLTEDMVDDIDELEVPEGLEEDVDELREVLDDQVDTAEELAGIGDLSDEQSEQLRDSVDDTEAAFEDVGAECEMGRSEEDLEGEDPTTTEPTEDDPLSTVPVIEAQTPESFIVEYGTVPEFDALADACYEGDLTACDQLYSDTPVSESPNSYEGYGASCGGRRTEELAGTCAQGL